MHPFINIYSMKKLIQWGLLSGVLLMSACSEKENSPSQQPIHKDAAFSQEYSIKYDLHQEGTILQRVYTDRNGVIQLYGSTGLLKPYAGEFLYPGSLVPDKTYRPMADKKILGLGIYDDQFVYLTDKGVLSNAWAGELNSLYSLPNARLFEGGLDFAFLISDGLSLQYIKDSNLIWQGKNVGKILDIIYDKTRNAFWLLSGNAISVFKVESQELSAVFSAQDLTCFALTQNSEDLIVGTNDGYLSLDANTGQPKTALNKKLPWTKITTISVLGEKAWFGTDRGAFVANDSGKFDYYASKRWLPSDVVIDIQKGPGHSVLILTDKGLAKLEQEKMTLHDKAMYFEQQVRARHIRHGFNATMGYMQDGSLATGSLEDSDNDGLWTSMYLGAEVFRYAVTKSNDALENIKESMDAMERLYSINGVKGFPSRSFERTGYKYHDEAWRRTTDPEWDWKSTTSSDEAIGHIFVFGAMAELLVDQKGLQERAVTLIDSLMQHTIDNDFYMIDWNGEPTLWGRWNPKYVNARPVGVGDRKINSSNIIAMLQTAYHFTKKEVYKEKAFELMADHGYFDNLMFPMSEVRMADENADDWSKMLSESWNHSDDEMYFVGYWGLYRYAFNDTLKTRFKEAIIDHWQIERPEKEGAWNIFTALTGTNDFDLDEAIWYLQKYPLDLIHWKVTNSHRKDIEMIEPNFRKQTTTEVLPASELPISRHNANRFTLDGGDNGTSEFSAGDIWLLPYWMGRYLNVIGPPVGPAGVDTL
jgi:hypothetical protein